MDGREKQPCSKGSACSACICLDKFEAGNETVDRKEPALASLERSRIARNKDFDSFNEE